ncbi:MAG: DUF255 domain-containing protein [Planctomycetota bacterium]
MQQTQIVQRVQYSLALLLLVCSCTSPPISNKDSSSDSIAWEEWSPRIFQKAHTENRLVLLDLGAVWCHWCHVMEETTYRDPQVIGLIQKYYLPIKVDQDSRPDLSNRYKKYGWPATIIFDSKGQELVKRRGYLEPQEMATLLKTQAEHPFPEEESSAIVVSKNAPSFLSTELQEELQKEYFSGYDFQMGSWGKGHNKFLDWDSVEYALVKAKQGSVQDQQMAIQTLQAQLKLFDPIWGGVYQYSTGGVWENPHFEKIMFFQAGNLRVYALATLFTKDIQYLKAAQEIHRYLRTFLTSPQGAFYTSQDADLVPGKHSGEYFNLSDQERRFLGVPRVDTHIYSRENGVAITALVSLYCATGTPQYLQEAETAAQWILENRAYQDGGFFHGENQKETDPLYLGDTLLMGEAFLRLYLATGAKKWILQAQQSARFIEKYFLHSSGTGFITTFVPNPLVGVFADPLIEIEENTLAMRFYNLLFHYTVDQHFRKMAESSMRFLATPEVATSQKIWVAGILLAQHEITQDPPHWTIVGSKKDPEAAALFQMALKIPTEYKHIEWLDKQEGPLPHTEVSYPELARAAAFKCDNKSCSLPVFFDPSQNSLE